MDAQSITRRVHQSRSRRRLSPIIGMSDNAERSLWPAFPCEDQTRRELEEWLESWDSSVKATEIEALLAGEIPASLIGISAETDLTDVVLLSPAQSESQVDMARRPTHNSRVRAAYRAESLRKQEYESKLIQMRNAFAGKLGRAMRESAPARLRALHFKHLLRTSSSGVKAFDRGAMYQTLKAQHGPTQRRSARWYERQWELLRDTVLADNYTSQEKSDKVHLLLTKHPPHFETVRLEGTVLPDALIAFMPACNAQEGRGIRRGLIIEGTNDDHEEAVRR